MSEVKRPRVATWLLSVTAPRAWSDAVAGDLLEAYQQRRSKKWYWRQVLTIIRIEVLKDLKNHWVLALRALAVAVASTAMVQRLHLAGRLLDGTAALIGLGPYLVIAAALEPFLLCAPAGLAVALTHRKQQATMVLVYAAALSIFHILVVRPDPARGMFVCLLFCESAIFAVAGALIGGFVGRAWAQPARR